MVQYIQCTRKEHMELLRRELTDYEIWIGGMTADERKGLHKWVADGSSPYGNPWGYCQESGHAVDYIMAIRIIEDMLNNPDDYRLAFEVAVDDFDLADDVPF